MKPQSSFQAQHLQQKRDKQSTCDPRNCFIYSLFFFFTAAWLLAVAKIFLLDAAKNQPVLHTATRPVMGAHDFDRLHMKTATEHNRHIDSPLPPHPPAIPLTANSNSNSKPKSGGGKSKTLTYLKPPKSAPPPADPPATPLIPANALSWPPVTSDGSIPPLDGFDNMTMTNLAVPRFWDPPSGVPLEQVGSKVGGVETIFLMIASYRDFQCRETIASAYRNADHPEALFVGAVDQLSAGDIACTKLDVPCETNPDQVICKYRQQIASFEMSAEMATGPVTARHIGDRLYRGQYYVMQMDAHCQFVKHWDTLLIGQWRETRNEMAVLSSYLSDVQGAINPSTGRSNRNTRPIMCWG
jgi:hypothetical protein